VPGGGHCSYYCLMLPISRRLFLVCSWASHHRQRLDRAAYSSGDCRLRARGHGRRAGDGASDCSFASSRGCDTGTSTSTSTSTADTRQFGCGLAVVDNCRMWRSHETKAHPAYDKFQIQHSRQGMVRRHLTRHSWIAA